MTIIVRVIYPLNQIITANQSTMINRDIYNNEYRDQTQPAYIREESFFYINIYSITKLHVCKLTNKNNQSALKVMALFIDVRTQSILVCKLSSIKIMKINLSNLFNSQGQPHTNLRNFMGQI